MFAYGKMANYAIASMSYLAANYEEEGFTANADRIAKARAISKPLVSKLMSRMSMAGLVQGKPGPGGGFVLGRKPEEISLLEIVSLFERVDEQLSCPFGPGWCGVGSYCPLHLELEARKQEILQWLAETNLRLFADDPVKPDRSNESSPDGQITRHRSDPPSNGEGISASRTSPLGRASSPKGLL